MRHENHQGFTVCCIIWIPCITSQFEMLPWLLDNDLVTYIVALDVEKSTSPGFAPLVLYPAITLLSMDVLSRQQSCPFPPKKLTVLTAWRNGQMPTPVVECNMLAYYWVQHIQAPKQK